MVLSGRFWIQWISGNLEVESTILFPIVWGHRCTFEVDTLGGLIHHQNESFILFLSGSYIERQCRCPAEKVRIQDAGQKKGRIWELLCLQQAHRCHYPTTAYCFSSRRQIDESPSLVFNQTWELFSHWIHPSFIFARFRKSSRLHLVVQGVCDCGSKS